MALYTYISQLKQAVELQNGDKLGGLLVKSALRKKKEGSGFKIQSNVGSLEPAIEKLPNIDDYCHGQLPSPYDEIMLHHFKGLIAVSKSKFTDAYGHQSNLLFGSESTNWAFRALYATAIDLRIIAAKADVELRGKGSTGNREEDAGRILQTCYGICIRDDANKEGSKKLCTYHVINQLFRIYFSIKKAKNCKSLIRPTETPGFPAYSRFPISQVVTFKYFVGRLNTYEGKLKHAEQDLTMAFNGCTKKSFKNKSQILIFLLPVKIILGKMPALSLLERYNLPQFVNLVKGIKTGDLKLFDEALQTHYKFFAKQGIYLMLERAKTLVYRTLVKKIYVILSKQTKIKLQMIKTAMDWLGNEMDLDEIECIVANLIFKGYIKGYLSHQMRVLVVSAKTPFPAIKSVPVE